MSIFNNLEENYWRNLITKTILVIFTVAIIVWFLPRNEGRQFRYDVGKPWMYGSVIATFDFLSTRNAFFVKPFHVKFLNKATVGKHYGT
jgi:hypothetical protein